MELAHLNSYIRDVFMACDVIRLEAERANLSRRTYLLAGPTKDSLGDAPNHSAPPALAYKFSTFKSPASALRKIVAVSAKTSCPAMRTPRHLASNLSAVILPRSSQSRSWKNSESLLAAREPRMRKG